MEEAGRSQGSELLVVAKCGVREEGWREGGKKEFVAGVQGGNI